MATAIEPETAAELEPSGSFAQGMALGFAIAALAIHLVLASMSSGWAEMYRDFQAGIPLMTRVTLSIPWKAGIGLGGGAAIAVLIIRRPRGVALYVAVAIVLGIAAAMTWWYPTAPITELAGAIK